ncbi:MAG: GyrI-like domain-containing protein [Brevefilum sp.]|nr:GyrI-like domain-containing protein [Brevefilum sp.]
MLKIGDFSKIAQVSIKTLRYYDTLGLLSPAHIDRYSGYRYYELSQLVTLNRILALKDLDFSLDQVKEMLTVDLSSDVMEKLLKDKAAELQQRILDENARLMRVESRLAQLREALDDRLKPVVLKSSPTQYLASIRQILPSVKDLADWQKDRLDAIDKRLKETSLRSYETSILIYHQDEYREVKVDVEIGRFLEIRKQHAELKNINDSLQIYTLPAVNHLATTIHTGGAENIGETYTSLAGWTQANGFIPIGTWREVSYAPGAPGGKQIIEVQRPVMNAIKFYIQLEANEMEPKIITKDGFTLVGLRYFGKNEHMEIPQLWETFNQRKNELGGLPNETGDAAIGLCITPEGEPVDGAFEYVAGLPVSEAEDVPQDFVVRHVPEYTYAVFAHKGDLPSLGKTYEYIYQTWLPQSGYKLAAKIDFEYYDSDFKDFSPDSVFYIYLPIEKI